MSLPFVFFGLKSHCAEITLDSGNVVSYFTLATQVVVNFSQYARSSLSLIVAEAPFAIRQYLGMIV